MHSDRSNVARKFYTAYSKNVERQKGLDQKLSFENIETNTVLILIPGMDRRQVTNCPLESLGLSFLAHDQFVSKPSRPSGLLAEKRLIDFFFLPFFFSA